MNEDQKFSSFQDSDQGSNNFWSGLEKLADTLSSVDSNSSIDEIEMKIAASIRDLIKCEAVSIAIQDHTPDEIIIKKTLISDREWIYQVGLRPGESILGRCLEVGEPFISNQPQLDQDYIESIDSAANISLDSLIVVPLKHNEDIVGLVACQNKKDSVFGERDVTLLSAIGKIIIPSLMSVRKIQQLQVINAHLEASRWELIRSRNTLRSLIDNLPVSLYIIDRMYRLVAVNSARAQRTNDRPHSLVGKVCFEALFHREEPCLNCLVGETFFNKKSTFRTERFWLEKGETQEWEIGSYPILDEAGGVLQVILVEEDVTERKRMESILTQSEKMAAVGQLAAGIAHEINNPLTVILANAQILQKELPDDKDWKELAEFIHRAGTRALNSVRNLLNFARKEPLDFEPLNINDTIERAVEMIHHEITRHSVDLTIELEPNLPVILASANNLQSVWLNLMMNAIDSMQDTQGKLLVRSWLQDNEIRISISDNGHGIPEDSLSRIFEPFYTTKGPSEGTGLGLSICHRIIKQHGGHITVDSVVGKGTSFTVNIPTY